MATRATRSDSPNEELRFGSSIRSSVRWLPLTFSVVLLAAVVLAALHFAEAQEFAHIAKHAEPSWLALALLLQAGTYAAAGQVFRGVARAAGNPLGLAAAYRLSLTKLFVDQAVPSAGLSGTVVLANGLQRQGIARPVVAAGVVVDLASYYAAYVLGLGFALIITVTRGEANAIILLVSLLFVLFGVALSVVVLTLAGKRTRMVPDRFAILRPIRSAIDFIEHADPKLARNPALLLRASMCQMAIVLCDAATVWVLIRSLGAHGSLTGVFASFMISSILRRGLGTFEAASVVTLRMVGIPTAVALTATLAFRGFSFWLPMLPGFWFSRRMMSRPAAEPTGR